MVNNSINKYTKDYITFKISSACESIPKALVVQFACIYVYQQIGEILKSSRSNYLQDSNLSEWLNLLISFSNREYFEAFCYILDRHQLFSELSTEETNDLTQLFLLACQFEHEFINALLP